MKKKSSVLKRKADIGLAGGHSLAMAELHVLCITKNVPLVPTYLKQLKVV